jgi:hypothetical protein
MADVLRDLHVKAFYYNGQLRSFDRYQEVLSLAASRAGRTVVVRTALDLILGLSGSTVLRFLPPLATGAAPELQIVSANGTSHPRVRATALLRSRPGATTLCTNVHGDIEVRVDAAGGYAVSVETSAGAPCVPGSDATS